MGLLASKEEKQKYPVSKAVDGVKPSLKSEVLEWGNIIWDVELGYPFPRGYPLEMAWVSTFALFG